MMQGNAGFFLANVGYFFGHFVHSHPIFFGFFCPFLSHFWSFFWLPLANCLPLATVGHFWQFWPFLAAFGCLVAFAFIMAKKWAKRGSQTVPQKIVAKAAKAPKKPSKMAKKWPKMGQKPEKHLWGPNRCRAVGAMGGCSLVLAGVGAKLPLWCLKGWGYQRISAAGGTPDGWIPPKSSINSPDNGCVVVNQHNSPSTIGSRICCALSLPSCMVQARIWMANQACLLLCWAGLCLRSHLFWPVSPFDFCSVLRNKVAGENISMENFIFCMLWSLEFCCGLLGWSFYNLDIIWSQSPRKELLLGGGKWVFVLFSNPQISSFPIGRPPRSWFEQPIWSSSQIMKEVYFKNQTVDNFFKKKPSPKSIR